MHCSQRALLSRWLRFYARTHPVRAILFPSSYVSPSPHPAATAPRYAVAELGVVRRCSRLVKLKFAILGLLAVAAVITPVAIIWRTRAAEAAVWRDLLHSVPAQPLTPAEVQITDGPLSARITPDNNEAGSIRLANGDTWRFAFRSHHVVGGPDSFSVFAGPSGTFRVRGDYFCCEVQIPDEALSKDSAAFVAFLHRVHPSVEPVK